MPLLSALGDRGELIRGWTDSEILFTKRCFMEYILSGVLLPIIFLSYSKVGVCCLLYPSGNIFVFVDVLVFVFEFVFY